MMIKSLLILNLFLTGVCLADSDHVTKIKTALKTELINTYLPSMEKKLGNCQNSACLEKIESDNPNEQFWLAHFPKKDICFPDTMCGFYKCMENTYRCEDVGVNYFTKLAAPTCAAYEANLAQNKFSEKGVEWIYTVMVCLQKGLATECADENNCPRAANSIEMKKTCDHITEFTLKYHPGCYIKSGVGVCRLPMADKLAIWKTVNPFMTARERREAYKVIFECLTP